MKLLLNVENLKKQFGGVAALNSYNIRIRPGELVGLIGPNGAGKTTVFNLLSGVLFHTKAYRRAEIDMERRADKLLNLFELTSVMDTPASQLPYGIQRRVEIARAMATMPRQKRLS